MGTFHRHNDVYTVQTVYSEMHLSCTLPLPLNLPITLNFMNLFIFIKDYSFMIYK